MRRTQILAACWLALAVLSVMLVPARANAQDDLRGILPYIMLVVDTSGSMERLPTCACTSPACSECLPKCNDATAPMSQKKNRWAVTLEALTGTFNAFSCEPLARNAANGMTYDLGYYLPYHQPWDCAAPQAALTPCSFDSTPATRSQVADGILDLNMSGVRFGLMTFDGWDTYIGAPPLVPESAFDTNRSNAVQGLWSYGDPDPLRKKTFHYPNCTTNYQMDTGARSATATEGSLISLQSCTGGGMPGSTPACPLWCSTCNPTQVSINGDIQEALLSARPYGGTPIAASLDDLYYHLSRDLSDEFRGCRDRFALLITDGYPDDDYRSYGCNCANEGSPTDPNRCGPPPNDPAAMHCPYPTAEEAARDLVQGRGTENPMVERVYVVGLAVDDIVVVNRLNAIADSGCTQTAAVCENGDQTGDLVPDQALFATDPTSLKRAITNIVRASNHPVSRTVPVFSLSNDPSVPQYQFTTALRTPVETGEPWSGILERRRFVCGTTPGFVPLTATDRFHERVNNYPATRVLRTALPTGTTTSATLNGTLTKTAGSCGSAGCDMVALSGVAPELIHATTTIRDQTIAWMYGSPGSVRENVKLGAIYHSSPVIVGAPQFDSADPNFNAFRRAPTVAARPQVLYVGSNDGILHAIATGPFTSPASAPAGWGNLVDGQELWGFVPPMLLDKVYNNLTSPLRLMDGTPVVKNVNVDTALGAAGYKTILIAGMREGGNAYVALDVTDPFDPKFLWQMTNPLIGMTFGKPAIVQATFQRPAAGGGTTQVKTGAVAILPGGVGTQLANAVGCNGAINESMRNGSARFDTTALDALGNPRPLVHRADVRCWAAAGRALFFVDVQDGYVIKTIHLADPTQPMSATNEPVFPSPLVSTPAPFPDEVGIPATRVFITDADGVVWRIDMRTPANNDPMPGDPMSGWTARPFHDLFWGPNGQPFDGELSYEAPVLSVDVEGRPVVIVGTGDTADFVKPTVRNRIVSLTEMETGFADESALHYTALLNWEMRVKNTSIATTMTNGGAITVDGLQDSELVTGPMALFESQLYAGTFIALTSTTDVCDLGRGRILALDYVERDILDSNGTTPPTFGPRRVNAGDLANTNNIVNILHTNSAGDNVLISGLSLTQRPSCSAADSTYADPWGSNWAGTSGAPAAGGGTFLVAHANFDNNGSSLVREADNSQVTTVEMGLNAPQRISKVMSWATSID